MWTLVTAEFEERHQRCQRRRRGRGGGAQTGKTTTWRRGHNAASVNTAEVTVELFEEDKTGARKYEGLANVIEQVKNNPDQWDEKSKCIREAEKRPFTDAISSADFIATTQSRQPKSVKPDIVIEDEQPRVMESTSLMLIAHFSPLGLPLTG